MSHQDIIKKNGYYIFDLIKNNDSDSITPIETKYTAIVLCLQGEAKIEANMESYHLNKGDCLCLGNVLYKSTIYMSEDFKARILICLNNFVFDSIVGIPMGVMESIYIKPNVNISNINILNIITNHFDNLTIMQNMNLGARQTELVALTFRSIILLMAMLRKDDLNINKSVYGQGDVYFRKFIELIENHVKREHEVAFYANMLHITPKYLSEICKQKSGHKAKEIISSFLISKLKQEIVMSGKSIKTIAYEYGFSDQSSMGKFFTKMTSMSPGDFRKGTNIATT